MIGAGRSQTWRWYICVLLLLATVVNYMDRLTVNTLATEIQAEFLLNNKQYGYLELGFGLAFAAGSLLFGWLVDRIGVYWLYPVVLVGWSAMGFLTGPEPDVRGAADPPDPARGSSRPGTSPAA